MIELIFFALAGSTSEIIDTIIQDIVILEQEVIKAQETFDLLDTKKRETEIKLNEIFASYEKWKKTNAKTDLNQAEQDQARYMEEKSKNDWRDKRDEVKRIKEKWTEAKKDLDLKKLELKLKETSLERIKKSELVRRYQNVGITLSKTCENLIKNNLMTNCPTYRELAQEYDNTEPQISGSFIDKGYDVKRSPTLKKHWNYYDRYPNHVLLMVDPDFEFSVRNTIVEIQSADFTVTSLIDETPIKYNEEGMIVWKNFKFTSDCKKIMVAPNDKDIENAVNFAMQNCYGDFKIEDEVIPVPKHGEIPWYESPATMYKVWLEAAKESHKGLMINK